MKWRDPKVWLGVLTLAVVVALVVRETEQTSPGPLTSVHEREGELIGGDGCERCHGDGPEEMAGACATCHADISAQIATHTGFHGSRKAVDVAKCALCHVEHHGDAVALVDARIFALAGVADVKQFEHDFVDFHLTGAHVALECAKCHKSAQATLLDKGAKRFGGLEQKCSTCHEDVHKGKFVKSCDACHGQERPFKEFAAFVHTEELPLAGAHANLTCVQCHEKDSARSVEALGGAGPKPAARRCEDCHASPHAPSFVVSVAASLTLEPKQSCIECHSTVAHSFKGADAQMRADLHAASGFALAAPHDKVECAKCHGDYAEQRVFAQRYPGRRADDCAACHADPHGGQFAVRGAPAPDCIQCHAPEHFAPSLFDVAAHERSAFALTGAHVQTECNACHTKSGESPRVFRGTAAACESCHADVHGASFAPRLASKSDAVRKAGGSCGVCHGTGRFDETRFATQEHNDFTSFALRGAHADAKCESCHVPRAKADEHGRKFGLVAERFPGASGACSTCHVDVHKGAFDRAGRAQQTSDGADCARCHGERKFAQLSVAFDHGAWTNFALDGAHEKAECAECHGANVDSRESNRKLGFVADKFPGPAERCSTCHLDVHDGVFDSALVPQVVGDLQSCARCHTSSDFATVERDAFEHSKWTKFALEGEHARTACEACHVPTQQPDAKGRRFGRASGNDCAACHADPHAGQFADANACSRCHAGAQSWKKLSFDHDRDSRYALDQKHKDLECSACHKPWPTADGRKVVRFKPLGIACGDCHGFKKQGTLFSGAGPDGAPWGIR